MRDILHHSVVECCRMLNQVERAPTSLVSSNILYHCINLIKKNVIIHKSDKRKISDKSHTIFHFWKHEVIMIILVAQNWSDLQLRHCVKHNHPGKQKSSHRFLNRNSQQHQSDREWFTRIAYSLLVVLNHPDDDRLKRNVARIKETMIGWCRSVRWVNARAKIMSAERLLRVLIPGVLVIAGVFLGMAVAQKGYTICDVQGCNCTVPAGGWKNVNCFLLDDQVRIVFFVRGFFCLRLEEVLSFRCNYAHI